MVAWDDLGERVYFFFGGEERSQIPLKGDLGACGLERAAHGQEPQEIQVGGDPEGKPKGHGGGGSVLSAPVLSKPWVPGSLATAWGLPPVGHGATAGGIPWHAL